MENYTDFRTAYYSNMKGWNKPNVASKAMMAAALEPEDTNEVLADLATIVQDAGVSLARLVETRCTRTLYHDKRTVYHSSGDRDWSLAIRCLQELGLMAIEEESENYVTGQFVTQETDDG